MPERIWRLVAAIPAGRVTTYGNLARLDGVPRGARQVGRALAMAPLQLPWHRVIAAGGRIALPPGSTARRTQIRLLRAEGITVVRGRVDMPAYSWNPDLDELLWGPIPEALQ